MWIANQEKVKNLNWARYEYIWRGLTLLEALPGVISGVGLKDDLGTKQPVIRSNVKEQRVPTSKAMIFEFETRPLNQ